MRPTKEPSVSHYHQQQPVEDVLCLVDRANRTREAQEPSGSAPAWHPGPLPSKVQRIYEKLAPLYPVSSLLFHTVAHERAMQLARAEDGTKVLEVGIGSGEFFRRLRQRNPNGHTVGVDFSYQMAARSLRLAVGDGAGAGVSCSASDARALPFRDECFDSIFVCFLLELLPSDGVTDALDEFHRVLAPGGRLALVLTGQNLQYFNAIYRRCTKYAPSVWGRQIEADVPSLMRSRRFQIVDDERTWQNGFPARVLVAERTPAAK